jgi:predicted ATPase
VRELPDGRLTLVFTDVEGSTRLLHDLGPSYAEALAGHRRVVRDAFGRHGGVEVDTQGDAFFYVFRDASEAVAAASEACGELAAGRVRIRVGVHTGTPQATGEGYVGADVHLAARIGAAGHGGQIVVSTAARRELSAPDLLRELGEHRLKDFDEAVPLFQVGDERFPPLRTISNTNLPRPASSFVGRKADVEEVVDRVRGGARLLTLTGPGGSGKTRLALEVAAELVPEFGAEVFWVGLAPVTDQALVLETVARMLGAQGELALHIGSRRLLLVLDNFEHLVDAAPALGELVAGCPNLHVLVTSRELLRLREETEQRVLPLPAEDAGRLFSERSGLPVDDSVEAVCAALDHLPLAVELAAARTDVLSPAQILDRLSGRLDLFRGARDADPRQQTLRAAIDWSHDLLDPDEQRLFARLAVFAGGWSLDAAEAVAGAGLDTLESLVQKSLVRHAGERFSMLETIREYALERLSGQEDADAVHGRHADWYLALAEEAEPHLDGPDQVVWLDRLEVDYPNVREVIRSGAYPGRLLGALRFFWAKRGYAEEGRRVLDELLPTVPDDDRAKPIGVAAACLLAVMQGDWPAAVAAGERCRELAHTHGDERPAIEVAPALGRALVALGEEERALALFEEAAERGMAVGRPAVAAIALLNLGYAALLRGELERAHEQLQRSLDLAASCGDGHAQARALAGLSSTALEGGRLAEAGAFAGRSLALAAPAGDRDNLCWALELAGAAVAPDDPARAAQLLGAAEALREELGLELGGLERAQHERTVARISATLGPSGLQAGLRVGRTVSPADAVALVPPGPALPV